MIKHLTILPGEANLTLRAPVIAGDRRHREVHVGAFAAGSALKFVAGVQRPTSMKAPQ
jgi:hypothetical protein